MSVHFNAIDVAIPKIIKRMETKVWIKQVGTQYERRVGEVNYIFCSDEEILRINKQYLKHYYYTDIITFDYSRGIDISGDLFISPETVQSNAEKYKTNYEEELYRVMIHGVLHLCGLKDKTMKDKKWMRQKEEEALAAWFILQGLQK